MRLPVPLLTLLCAISFAAPASDNIGSAVSTDDICAVRSDLCGGNSTRKRKKKPRAPDMDFADFDSDRPGRGRAASTLPKVEGIAPLPGERMKKKKKKSSKNSLAEFWERQEPTTNSAEPKPLDLERSPASEIQPETTAAPPAVRRRISFSSYLNANSLNGALSGRYGGQQDAFQQAPRPATLTAPASSAGTDNAAPDGTAGNGQSVREPTIPPPANYQN